MKYESGTAEMIHENATIDFKLGFISEARMRKYDEMRFAPETSKDNTAHETVNIEHANLATA